MRRSSFYFTALFLSLLAWVGFTPSYGGKGAQAAPTPPPGGLLWANRFGSSDGDNGHANAVDANGDVLVTGYFTGTVDFGGGPLTSAGGYDIYVAKFSGVDGAHLWSRRFGSTSHDVGYGIAADGSGNVLVSGYIQGTVDFGGGPLTSAGSYDIFVVKLSGANGAHLWSKRFGDTDYDLGYDVAADTSGNVLLAGNFSGTVDFGGGPLTSAGSRDIFVAKFSGADGSHLWSKRLGAADYDVPYAVAADGSGNVIVTGSFYDTVDFGGGPLTSAGSYDIFVAKFSGVDGAHLWSRQFGGPNQDTGNGVAVDGSGNVLVTGEFMGPVNFGGGPLTSAGSFDIFVAKFSGVDGTHLWSKRFGDTGDDGGRPIAVDGSGNVLVTGYFCGTVDFGGGPLTSAACGDIFVAKFSGVDGAPLWSKRFGGTSHDAGNGVAVDGSGNAMVTGSFQNTVDFDGEVLTSAGAYDIFVMKLASGITNRPPLANAGRDQTVECAGHGGTAVPLDGSASNDPDGDTLSYEWRDGAGNVVGTTAVIDPTLLLGSHLFNLTVDDGKGGTASDTVSVTVEDKIAPALTLARESYSIILPVGTPSKSLDVLAEAQPAASDVCDPAPTIVTNSPGVFYPGLTPVAIKATDACGNFTEKQFTVEVLTAAQAIQQLAGVVASYNLQQGIANSLDAKLQNTLDALNAANAGQRQDAANKLLAFINAVEAQRGKQLTSAQADALVSMAMRILAVL